MGPRGDGVTGRGDGGEAVGIDARLSGSAVGREWSADGSFRVALTVKQLGKGAPGSSTVSTATVCNATHTTCACCIDSMGS